MGRQRMAEGGEEGVVMGLLDIVKRPNTRLDEDAVIKKCSRRRKAETGERS